LASLYNGVMTSDRDIDRWDPLLRSVLRSPGHVDPAHRQEAFARAGCHAGSPDPGSSLLDEPLRAYVDQVALQAGAVTDADIAALLDQGLSEDGIFELTVAAALGAGRARLQRAREVLA
jgi:hypothetical protein